MSPLVLGHEINAAPVKPRRIDGRVVRKPLDGFISQDALAHWPYSLRPSDWQPGEPIRVETY